MTCAKGHDLDVLGSRQLGGTLGFYLTCRECNRVRARKWRLDNKDRTHRVRRFGILSGPQLRPEFKGP